MTERQGPKMPVKLTGSVTVSAKEYVAEEVLASQVMVLAKVSREQAEYLVDSGIWEGYMHQMRIEAFRHFQFQEGQE